ncbi:MAG TPA: hypothetical protein VKY19_22820 [Ktedonosporobacter sp.]|nr:hypothetical protein [Ktedonosporobacter sp.]
MINRYFGGVSGQGLYIDNKQYTQSGGGAATDPLLNAWFDSSLNSIGVDVTWHSHGYIVQKEWGNARRGCVLSGP